MRAVVMESSSAETHDNVTQEPRGASLLTQLGLAEGDVLTYVETSGAKSLRRVIRDSPWSSSMVLMAVGALIRERLIQGVQHELDVIVAPAPHTLSARQSRLDNHRPKGVDYDPMPEAEDGGAHGGADYSHLTGRR